MLNYIEKQIGIISGIPDQRLGEISNRETVGGVERAVMQSSHITEKIFKLHDHVKLRALELLLETAKFAWRNDKKKLQFVLDDMTASIFDVDGGQFNEAEYGIFVTDGTAENELRQTMKQLAHAGIQNDKLNFSALLDIYMSSNLSSMRRKIEQYERETMERMEAQQKEANKLQQQAIQAQSEAAQAQLDQKERESIRKAETDILLARINNEGDGDDPALIAFKAQMEAEKIELDRKKAKAQMEKDDKDAKLKKEALQETIRSNKAKEAIARAKPATSSKTTK
jgi:membrane protein involved in colicin uptake